MNFIVEFYQSLDTLNLILFWGIIIVIILLLAFSIIIANKNKKLKEMLILKENESKENDDVPLVTEKKEVIVDKPIIIEKQKEVEKEEPKDELDIEEKEFVAEEHVMEYNQNLFSLSNIKKVNNYKEEPIDKPKEVNKEVVPTGPYQRNVLREMRTNQTSPIGIVKRETKSEEIEKKARELEDSLHLEEDKKIDIKRENNNREYLNEVSKKLSESNKNDEITRTEYELQQEEDAIISYEELMQKKDSIKMVDEEDAVISIEELIEKKKEQEKLYQLTEESGNEKFIKELKNFRNDL